MYLARLRESSEDIFVFQGNRAMNRRSFKQTCIFERLLAGSTPASEDIVWCFDKFQPRGRFTTTMNKKYLLYLYI